MNRRTSSNLRQGGLIVSVCDHQETYRLVVTRTDGTRVPLCKSLSEAKAHEHRDILLCVGAFENVEIERHLPARDQYS